MIVTLKIIFEIFSEMNPENLIESILNSQMRKIQDIIKEVNYQARNFLEYREF